MLSDTKDQVVRISSFKVTDTKLLLARRKKRKDIKWRTRLSLCTIDAIATGAFFCGRPDSSAYRPSKQEWKLFRARWHAEDQKRKAAAKAQSVTPREMTKEDICNVELIHTDDLKDVFLSLLEAMTANVELEEKLFEEEWTLAEPSALGRNSGDEQALAMS